MKTIAFVSFFLSVFSAHAEEVSAVCSVQASEYAFTKYADDDFDYIEAVSEASALDAVEQNNTGLSDDDIKSFKELTDSGEYEFYQVSAGGIGDYIHILAYKKSDCAYVSTTSVFEE
jgi:hypothetical protein